MKHIKLFENFNYELIKEDILELKQMSKQMYSYFKSKGFPVEIEEKISSEKLKELSDKGMVKSGFSVGPNKKNAYQWKSGNKEESTIGKVSTGNFGSVPVKLHINEKEEYVMVALPGNEIARLLQKDGKEISLNATQGYTDIPEIVEYVNKIGVELQNMIKEKYPEMVYKFETQHGYWFIMYFGYQTTSKGGYKN
jgi:hypothetical protein